MNWVPKLRGTEPHCRLPGDWGGALRDDVDCIDMPLDEFLDTGDRNDLGLRLRESRLKFSTLW